MKEMDAMIAKMTYAKKKEAAAADVKSRGEKGQHGKLHETYD